MSGYQNDPSADPAQKRRYRMPVATGVAKAGIVKQPGIGADCARKTHPVYTGSGTPAAVRAARWRPASAGSSKSSLRWWYSRCQLI
jgi:hypothetical protein